MVRDYRLRSQQQQDQDGRAKLEQEHELDSEVELEMGKVLGAGKVVAEVEEERPISWGFSS